jgi:hypothetical protein
MVGFALFRIVTATSAAAGPSRDSWSSTWPSPSCVGVLHVHRTAAVHQAAGDLAGKWVAGPITRLGRDHVQVTMREQPTGRGVGPAAPVAGVDPDQVGGESDRLILGCGGCLGHRTGDGTG